MKQSGLLLFSPVCCLAQQPIRPNILIAIADDQSYPHASAYGSTWIHTPAFDRVASEGLLFSNCYACSPGSSPSRSSMLTGLFPWQQILLCIRQIFPGCRLPVRQKQMIQACNC